MPFKWDVTNSMQMLLLVIVETDVKPTTAVWTQVASKLGDITPTAVSQKFYTLKKECEQLKAGEGTSGPSTPKTKANGTPRTPGTGQGRKRKNAAAKDAGHSAKRTMKATADMAEEEPEENKTQNEAKAEEVDDDQSAD